MRAFLDRYRLNLLRWPRDGVETGRALIQRTDGSVIGCSLGDIFVRPYTSEPKEKDEPRASLSVSFSRKLEAGATLRLLEAVAATLGVAGKASVASAYGTAHTMQVRVRDVRGDLADIGGLARYVAGVDIQADQTLFEESDRLYVVVAVARAKAIEIIAFDRGGKSIKVSVEATGLGEASSPLKAEDEGNASLVYLGDRPLAFGVELMAIVPNVGGTSSWRLDTVKDLVDVRGASGGAKSEQQDEDDLADRRFLDDAVEGDAFFDWPE